MSKSYSINEIIELNILRQEIRSNEDSERQEITIGADNYPALTERLRNSEDAAAEFENLMQAIDPSLVEIESFKVNGEEKVAVQEENEWRFDEDKDDKVTQSDIDELQSVIEALQDVFAQEANSQPEPELEDIDEPVSAFSRLGDVLGDLANPIAEKLRNIDKEEAIRKANDLVGRAKVGAHKVTDKASDMSDVIRQKIEELNKVDGLGEEEIVTPSEIINEIRDTLDYAFELLEELEEKVTPQP